MIPLKNLARKGLTHGIMYIRWMLPAILLYVCHSEVFQWRMNEYTDIWYVSITQFDRHRAV